MEELIEQVLPLIKKSEYKYILFLAKEGKSDEIDASLTADANQRIIVCMIKSLAQARGMDILEYCINTALAALAFDAHHLNDDGTPKDVRMTEILEILKRK